jgi:hypothetical protein
LNRPNFLKVRITATAKALVKGLACLFFILSTSSFKPSETKLTHENEGYFGKQLVTLSSDEFKTYSNLFHFKLTYTTPDTISKPLFHKALRGYMYLKHTDALTNPKYLTIIDFSKFCNTKRLWVIDMETKTVVYNEMVAHGSRSGDEYPKYFSNSHGSNKSSLGFYTTGGTYWGSNNLSLKLNGLEKRYNSNAFTRGIVIHGANYVGDNYLKYNRRIGRSFGCPAVSQKINKKLIDTVKGGSCLFIYHPTKEYLENSEILNANLYITVDDLKL